MTTQAQNEAWLKQLVGTWTYHFTTTSDSEYPDFTITGTETVWPVGDFFVAMESKGVGADGSPSHSLVSLGYDPKKKRFSGAHAGTAIPVLFTYDGALAESSAALYLETEGPAMTEGNTVDRYRDIFRILDSNTREQVLQVLDVTGAWKEFARTRYTRAPN
jgi:Protein of unknown function (DUF1579)